MRTRTFRALAGVVATLFLVALLLGDLGKQPPQQLVWVIVVGVLFGVFATFGTKPAEWMLAMVFGIDSPDLPAVPPARTDEPAPRSEST